MQHLMLAAPGHLPLTVVPVQVDTSMQTPAWPLSVHGTPRGSWHVLPAVKSPLVARPSVHIWRQTRFVSPPTHLHSGNALVSILDCFTVVGTFSQVCLQDCPTTWALHTLGQILGVAFLQTVLQASDFRAEHCSLHRAPAISSQRLAHLAM